MAWITQICFHPWSSFYRWDSSEERLFPLWPLFALVLSPLPSCLHSICLIGSHFLHIPWQPSHNHRTALKDMIRKFHTPAPGIMVYSHFTGTGPGTDSMGSNILCRYVHTGLRQRLRPIVSYCASPVQCTGPVPVQYEWAMRPGTIWCRSFHTAAGVPLCVLKTSCKKRDSLRELPSSQNGYVSPPSWSHSYSGCCVKASM